MNLGCRKRISSGLDWVFEQVEETIVLEDDCLPDPSFFRFCEELLEVYRDDERVGIISGDNFQFGRQRTSESYYFSRFAHIWGWASWRRTWQQYDAGMQQWPFVKEGGWLTDILQDTKMVKYWSKNFDAVFNNKIDTWDYQLVFSIWIQARLNIMPTVNLVSNIGFGADAMHTVEINKFSEMPVAEMNFPLIHPQMIIRDALADEQTAKEQFRPPSVVSQVKYMISLFLRLVQKQQR